jgi:cytochrome P450 family 144
MPGLYHARRILLSYGAEYFLHLLAWQFRMREQLSSWLGQEEDVGKSTPVSKPKRPEDIDPTAAGNIEHPYEYYRLLRDQRPVFKPTGQDFYCISRYADIQEVARETEVYSSNIVGVLQDKRLGRQVSAQALRKSGVGSQRNYGIYPVDVLAIQDPPAHKYQKLLTHKIVSAPFVNGLEAEVQSLADELFGRFLPPGRASGQVEFMQQVAWPLPMIMAMRIVGFPDADYPRVKDGCAHAIRLLSGVISTAEFASHSARTLDFVRYCWQQYLRIKAKPADNITGSLARAAADPDHPLTDEEAISIIVQLLIAGSDSSASTMGNAVRLLIENPGIEQRLRREPERIGDFVEEVLRLESAFQGHFRVVKQDTELHGVPLPKGTRLFLLWASGNRDERFWNNPDQIDIDRDNLKKHLTFGYGIHACLGRELARMEIRIVLETLLERTRNLRVSGPAPHVTSLFTRTLEKLPVSFEAAPGPGSGL